MDDWDKFNGTNFTMRSPQNTEESETGRQTYESAYDAARESVYGAETETSASTTGSQAAGDFTENTSDEKPYGTAYETAYATSGKVKKPKAPKYVTRKAFVITLIISMLFSATIGAGAYAMAMSVFGGSTIDRSISTTNYNLATNTGSPLSVQEIVAKNENSVVAIVTESVSTDTWLGQYVTQGAGSGVIISEDGYIVTNNHVVAGASNIRVTLHDGSEVPATLIATDEQTDVAVIKIDKTGLVPVTFGKSSDLNVGDLAIAIGNPLGHLAGSATEGIISGLEREITIDGKAMTLIQTSASINPGNSGGGLFDQYGNLIGIVVAKSAGSEVEGLGFAIPVDLVQKVASSLMENGFVAGRPAAGITIKDLTSASDAMQYGVQITGVYVVEVTGNNAKKAGFQPGDLIYYLEDTKITSGAQLVGLIQKKEIGDKVTFSVVRNNEIVEITLELEDSQSIQPSQLTQPQAGQQQGQ
ncbi:MAG: PDZ domain-containing protein [Firmicutes bacterium]|nr:PDZ domain-containing protein [Bacillota bacterium]